MPRVNVQWIEGRSQAQRQEIARRITEAFVDVLGIAPDRVQVAFFEYPASHHFKGGVASGDGSPTTTGSRKRD